MNMMRRIDWFYICRQLAFLLGLLVILHAVWECCIPAAKLLGGFLICAIAAYQSGRKRG